MTSELAERLFRALADGWGFRSLYLSGHSKCRHTLMVSRPGEDEWKMHFVPGTTLSHLALDGLLDDAKVPGSKKDRKEGWGWRL